jgi:hypothetical protein
MIPGSLFCCCYNFLIFGRVHSKTLVQLFEEGIVPFIVVPDCHCISCRNYWQGFDINCQVVAAVGLNYTYWLFCWHLPIDSPYRFSAILLPWCCVLQLCLSQHLDAFCRQRLELVLRHYQWLVTYTFTIFF